MEEMEEKERLVEKGVDIYVEDDFSIMSPLYFLISRYYYADIKYRSIF